MHWYSIQVKWLHSHILKQQFINFFSSSIMWSFHCKKLMKKKKEKRKKTKKATTKFHNTSFISLCYSRFERKCVCVFFLCCVHFLIGFVSNKFLTLGYSIGHYSVPHSIPSHCYTGLSELNYDVILVNRFCMGKPEATKKNKCIRNSWRSREARDNLFSINGSCYGRNIFIYDNCYQIYSAEIILLNK